MKLGLHTRALGEYIVAELDGPLDFSTAPQLWEALWPSVLCREDPRVILDLSGVEFMDSTGLSVIIDAWREVDGRGGTLQLARAQRQAAKVLQITSLDVVFPIYSSPEAAALTSCGETS